jgi:hypothetical protein
MIAVIAADSDSFIIVVALLALALYMLPAVIARCSDAG